MWPAPSWLHSSVSRTLHRYHRGHGFESRSSPNFFQAKFYNSVSCVHMIPAMDNHVFISLHDVWFMQLYDWSCNRKILYINIEQNLPTQPSVGQLCVIFEGPVQSLPPKAGAGSVQVLVRVLVECVHGWHGVQSDQSVQPPCKAGGTKNCNKKKTIFFEIYERCIFYSKYKKSLKVRTTFPFPE